MSSTEFRIPPAPLGIGTRLRDRSGDVSASEPFNVFVLKSLLYPVIPVFTLILCLLFFQERPYGPYLLVAVLSFLGVADLLDVMPMRITPAVAMALRSLIDIALRWSLLMAFTFALLKLSGFVKVFDVTVLMVWAGITPIALWATEMVAQKLLVRAGSLSGFERTALIVGMTPVGMQLQQNLRSRPTVGIRVLGYFEDRDKSRVSPDCHGQSLGRLSDIGGYVSANNVDIVYIALPMAPHPRIVDLLSSLRDSTASVYFVPDLKVFELVQPRFDLVDGIPVIAVCETPFYGVRGLAKRILDICLAGFAVLFLSPVFLLIAICVKMNSPGAAIYRQRRYGLDGREIVIYKFRSLSVVEDGETSYTQVGRNDARVTTVGAFLRKTSLDELPQLFNVLLGNMSIVGPRPHAIAVNEQYRRQIPGYMVRHKVKPGITGWAQVNGYRGGDDLDSMAMRISFDLEYLRCWSLGLDLVIILKTARVIWRDRHAY